MSFLPSFLAHALRAHIESTNVGTKNEKQKHIMFYFSPEQFFCADNDRRPTTDYRPKALRALRTLRTLRAYKTYGTYGTYKPFSPFSPFWPFPSPKLGEGGRSPGEVCRASPPKKDRIPQSCILNFAFFSLSPGVVSKKIQENL